MYDILTLNKISKTGLERFTDEYQYGDAVENPQGIMVRSASMHEMEMPQSLLAIARAGAGVNNIPVDQCTEKGIVVFNTPGANANAVKELVLAGLLISSRKVTQGMAWAQGLKARGMRSARPWKRARALLSALRSRERSWALSAWAPSASWWPTPPEAWAWRFTLRSLYLCGFRLGPFQSGQAQPDPGRYF